MPDNVSALQLLLTADPTLLAIVRLSLLVSFAAVILGGLIGVPLGAGVALTRFAGREVVIVVLNALMGFAARRRGARRLSPAVAFGPARIVGPAVHPAGDDHRADHPRRTDHRGADAADHRGLVDRVPRRARDHGCRPARAHRDPDLGRPLQPGH